MKPIIKIIQDKVPFCKYRVDVPLKSIPHNIENYGIDMNPDYQRNYIWTQEQKEKFVGSLIENPDLIPHFYFNIKDYIMDSCEVVDGKQRLSAIVDWLKGDIIALCPCGISLYRKDLDKVSETLIRVSITTSWKFVKLNKIEVMEFYLRLNSGGTIHSEEDLQRVKDLIIEQKESRI